MALGVGKEVFGVGVLMGVLRGSLAADRPGPCGVHILCAAIRSTAEHKKGQCGVRGAVFGWAGGGRARAGAGSVVFAGRARVGRVHAAEGVLDARGIGPVFYRIRNFSKGRGVGGGAQERTLPLFRGKNRRSRRT